MRLKAIGNREFGTWKKLDEEESVTIGLRREDALFRSKLIVGVNQMAAGGDESGHPHLLGMLPDFKYWSLSSSI